MARMNQGTGCGDHSLADADAENAYPGEGCLGLVHPDNWPHGTVQQVEDLGEVNPDDEVGGRPEDHQMDNAQPQEGETVATGQAESLEEMEINMDTIQVERHGEETVGWTCEPESAVSPKEHVAFEEHRPRSASRARKT